MSTGVEIVSNTGKVFSISTSCAQMLCARNTVKPLITSLFICLPPFRNFASPSSVSPWNNRGKVVLIQAHHYLGKPKEFSLFEVIRNQLQPYWHTFIICSTGHRNAGHTGDVGLDGIQISEIHFYRIIRVLT